MKSAIERAFQLGEGVVCSLAHHLLPLSRAQPYNSPACARPQGSAVEAGFLVPVHEVRLAVFFGKLSTFSGCKRLQLSWLPTGLCLQHARVWASACTARETMPAQGSVVVVVGEAVLPCRARLLH